MKVVAVVSGARKGGNCAGLTQKLVSKLGRYGISNLETQIYELARHKVMPCWECSYECFQANCPIEDDARELIRAMYSADVTLLVVPTYGGLPPASFIALLQRRQNEMPKLSPPRQYVLGIVLANDVSENGEFTPDIVRSVVEQWGADRSQCLLLKPREFQRSALQTGLADIPAVENELEQLAESIWQWHQSSNLGVYKGAM